MADQNLISAEEYGQLEKQTADHRITYGDDPSQFGDLFLPEGNGPHPVLFLLHGGCWRARYGLEPMGQLARAIAPVCDLERAVAWDICEEASDLLVGGHPRQNYENYYQGSPSALLPLSIRHITINGTLDNTVPIEYVQHFVESAYKLGDDTTLIGVPDVGHFEIVMANHPAGQLVIETILSELR